MPTPSPPSPSLDPTLKSQKTTLLHTKITTALTDIAAAEAQITRTRLQLKCTDPAALVKKHIALLHAYNEIRDVGAALVGVVAEARGVRVADVYAGFGVGVGD